MSYIIGIGISIGIAKINFGLKWLLLFLFWNNFIAFIIFFALSCSASLLLCLKILISVGFPIHPSKSAIDFTRKCLSEFLEAAVRYFFKNIAAQKFLLNFPIKHSFLVLLGLLWSFPKSSSEQLFCKILLIPTSVKRNFTLYVISLF